MAIKEPVILSIDTSCDETAAAVTSGLNVVSNIVWSQASLHAKWGGVKPSLAKRLHEERIDWIVEKALKSSKTDIADIDAVAVTTTPGLSIALGVGIDKAKKLSIKHKKKLIAVNHIEAHLLSSLAHPLSKNIKKYKNTNISFPSYGLVVSGGNTIIVLIEDFGRYKILAQTVDDALGEALDKGARMLGLGYPGGTALEKLAKKGDMFSYNLPIPLLGREDEGRLSYSGLKTAFYRLVNNLSQDKNLIINEKEIINLAAAYHEACFAHFDLVLDKTIERTFQQEYKDVLTGGGVISNIELRKKIRKTSKKYGLTAHFPYSKKLCMDNAAMIGVTANFKFKNSEFISTKKIDREPRLITESGFIKI